MRVTKYILFAVFFIAGLLIFGIIFYYRVYNQSASWYCSSTGVRGGEEELWKRTFSPAQPPEVIDSNLFDKYIVTSDANNYYIKFPSDPGPAEPSLSEPYEYDLYEINPGETLDIGGGTFEYVGLGTAFLDANNLWQEQVKYKFFDAENQYVSPNDVFPKLGVYGSSSEYVSNFQSRPFPSVNFGFHYENIDNIKVNYIRIFDANTHKSLSSGYSSDRFKNYDWMKANLTLLYRTPIDVVLDLSYGQSHTHEFPALAGEGFDEPDFKCRLLDVFEGVDPSFGWSESGFKRTTGSNSRTVLYFVCQPTASYIPVTFEVLNRDGKRINGGNAASGYNYLTFINPPVEKIALIKATYLSRRARVVVHLPYIPGLPEQNNKINNLFDVRVPYAKFASQYNLENFLEQTLQLSSRVITGPVPANSIKNLQFPLEFENVTVRDIAKIYATGGNLSVDIENDRLELEYPLPLGARVKQFLERILQRK